MQKRVYKYIVCKSEEFGETVAIKMPRGAVITSVDCEFGYFILWVLVDPDEEVINRHVHLAATGAEIPDFKGRLPVFIGRIDAIPIASNTAFKYRFHAFDFGETPL
ncbi:hypothetical protein CPT_Maja_056 [Burkholderia phage Maja]|uniref:DUF7352 domain-containing protein n=1 Tax=Burkholderia phage Maja TaxID=2767571 RepID=A0A7S6R782_9CAUD|nr:hypothetical protein CPT_Maja_056 [Burkholderia phage Maja]